MSRTQLLEAALVGGAPHEQARTVGGVGGGGDELLPEARDFVRFLAGGWKK